MEIKVTKSNIVSAIKPIRKVINQSRNIVSRKTPIDEYVKSTPKIVEKPFMPVPEDYPNQRLKQYFKSLGINWNTHVEK